MSLKIHNVIQGSDEWFDVREGKATASHASKIGNCGTGLYTYIDEKMAEYFSKERKPHFSNEHTERGILLEPDSRVEYEMKYKVEVDEVGFIEYNPYIGCSPDGLVGEDGGTEYKCHTDLKHYLLLKHGEKKVESNYKWQIQMCLLITGREWWDYVAYNPNFEECLFVHRYYPDEDKFRKLLQGFDIFEEEVEKIKRQFEEDGII